MRQLVGVGLGWRPETAWFIHKYEDLAFVEVIAESLNPRNLPMALRQLVDRGVQVALHCVSLSLGSPAPLSTQKLDHVAQLAEQLQAVWVSDHIAYASAGERYSPHFVPVPRTSVQLQVLVDNIVKLRAHVARPIALENPAALFEWPESEFSEAEFLSRLLQRAPCQLIVDVANLYANQRNLAQSIEDVFAQISAARIAYLHVAGGHERGGTYIDTHAHAIPSDVFLALRRALASWGTLPILLERDDHFPTAEELGTEMLTLQNVLREETSYSPSKSDLANPDLKSESIPVSDVADNSGGFVSEQLQQLANRHADILERLLSPEQEVPADFSQVGFQAAGKIMRRKQNVRERRF